MTAKMKTGEKLSNYTTNENNDEIVERGNKTAIAKDNQYCKEV